MVMRDTPGLSVCPTVNDSMLKARRRKSDETRVNTPGLFSTYTANVVIIFPASLAQRALTESSVFLRRVPLCPQWLKYICSGFDDRRRTGPPDHGVKSRTRRHHRIHGVFLL